MKYEVEVVETIVCKVEIEADNPKKAYKLAYENNILEVTDESYSKVIQVTPLED